MPQFSNFKERVQPDKLDNRIHFLLNCGAKSCPRVKPLTNDNYESEADGLAESYINREASINEDCVTVPRIFLWYLGDFNGKDGVKELIGQYADGSTQDKSLYFDSYDWSRTEEFFE